ncbi:MAG: aminomethyl-transferring glycine dehydrogenase subunit GcvPA [Deltaproteobacteria bacterium]|nr:aminomethyl-transferring glycine dehydrogenase subunit GcvPA [Deltaproteobacteria bacterium]MBW1919588.1 aminomethyl-transferring glycine dehydrogenase subunit GcvPA [Deltaproteobacteria bacterium]MBW1934278.1 aminomethyl-transferring glycine dehydrogenase subunit GcvPA [Deltaproteobacteria bacterium]MBW1977509.1 aminomethyl-transferring glycine dehydrogenase subunit GcvPA [Deltaproteobacteria bacterium]MBW2043924.1 aminomethyl-transferring glycine dehydrogenase subunit GcvPA [Deltaproteobac
MRYLPHTPEEIESMLRLIGVKTLDELFSVIPQSCRRIKNMNLPGPLTEWELESKMTFLSRQSSIAPEFKVFLGAGNYEHFIPHALSYLTSRSEFSTSYTPYEPEMSQGTLQALYEYQTLCARLLGMEVVNASMYDGASALAESLLMAMRIKKLKKLAVSTLIHPLYRRVVRTYLEPTGFEVVELPWFKNGRTDLSPLDGIADLGAVAVQSPNFFGCVEDLDAASEMAQKKNALFMCCFTEPLAYGLYKNPGCFGADIVCGEGQSLGIPQSFGGPGLGIFATKMKYVRQMPGRVVGKTKDLKGRTGFVLTLAAREQHIRREKATSNICTNNNLCAIAAAMYMALLGSKGMHELARLNFDKCEYLKREMEKAGFRIAFSAPTFNEFVVELPPGFEKTRDRLIREKIIAGLPLAHHYPDLSHHYLFCVTETKTKEDIDALIEGIKA